MPTPRNLSRELGAAASPWRRAEEFAMIDPNSMIIGKMRPTISGPQCVFQSPLRFPLSPWIESPDFSPPRQRRRLN